MTICDPSPWLIRMLLIVALLAGCPITAAETPDLPIAQPLTAHGLLLGFAGSPAEKLKDVKLLFAAGEVISHDAESIYVGSGSVQLKKKGYAMQTAVLRWPLPDGVLPGHYRISTLFMLGGVSPQTFTIKAGQDAAHLAVRSGFRQANQKSWQMSWLAASREMTLLPGDKVIEIEVKGNASDQKHVRSFFLEYLEPFAIPDDPIQDVIAGSPQRWLVTESGGMAGLSLWGPDTERYLRPSIGDPSLAEAFDQLKLSSWKAISIRTDGLLVLNPSTADRTWARGTGLAHVYLYSERDRQCVLHVAQNGIMTEGLADGAKLNFVNDTKPPHKMNAKSGEEVGSKNEQGTELKIVTAGSQAPVMANITLKQGWNRLLLRLHMQHKAGGTFAFYAVLTDEQNQPVQDVKSTLNDPGANLELKSYARLLNRYVHTDEINNILRPGAPLKISYEILCQVQGVATENADSGISHEAAAELILTDYDGKEVARKTVEGRFPGRFDVDFGIPAQAGYYAVQGRLLDRNQKNVYSYPADGFCVVGGTAAQQTRRDQKKMAVTYYFMGAEKIRTTAFAWMEKMGVFRNIGSGPDFPLDLAELAAKSQFILTMDFWDMHNGYTQEQRNELVKKAAPFTRFFKSFNEVDIFKEVRRNPEEWTKRTQGEYEAVKAFGPKDSVYVGGSLVRPGTDEWFTGCLKLGIDQYLDAWDVHAYPQRAPRLEGTCSNSQNETELGVLKCYQQIGRENKLPFWLGETGARASHGSDARRWQAEMVAKMTACICSRSDFHYIGFLWPWQCLPSDDRPNDISTSHNPADAALYTASALIDGFPYSKMDVGNDIQAARFGETIMLWTEKAQQEVTLSLEGTGPWVQVDVIGRATPLSVTDQQVRVAISTSPVYIIPAASFKSLTSF